MRYCLLSRKWFSRRNRQEAKSATYPPSCLLLNHNDTKNTKACCLKRKVAKGAENAEDFVLGIKVVR